MIKVLTSVSKGWLHNEGGFEFDERYYSMPLTRQKIDQNIEDFLRIRFPEHAFYNLESNLVQIDHWHPNCVYVGGIQPNLILGLCIGAKMAWHKDKDIDLTETAPLAKLSSVDELPSVETILYHPFIQGLDAQIVELREKHPDLTTIPPFFWDTSGRATIHGFITTSMKFYGEKIFIKMKKDPDFVRGFHDWLADAYIALIRHFSVLGGMAVSTVHIGECSGAMLGANHYNGFVVPYINKIGDALGPIRLHSCGQSDHLLVPMQKILRLKILDSGSGTSVSRIRQTFGPDFEIHIAPPLNLLLEGSSRDAVKAWVEQTLIENDNGPLLIGYHLEPGYSLENCLAIQDELFQRGIVQKGGV